MLYITYFKLFRAIEGYKVCHTVPDYVDNIKVGDRITIALELSKVDNNGNEKYLGSFPIKTSISMIDKEVCKVGARHCLKLSYFLDPSEGMYNIIKETIKSLDKDD